MRYVLKQQLFSWDDGIGVLVRFVWRKEFVNENRYVQHAARQEKQGELVCHS